MTWLAGDQVLAALLEEARATLRQLGHETSGFAPSYGVPGEVSTLCTRCWLGARVRVRAWRQAGLSGAALVMRCR